MARRLLVVQDDLLFASRVQAIARRLELAADLVSPAQLEAGAFDPSAVVVIQLTIHPERQLSLLERLRARTPAQEVLAVSGHLEVALRRRAKALGARLASHSALERALARAATDEPGGPDAPQGPRGPGAPGGRGACA